MPRKKSRKVEDDEGSMPPDFEYMTDDEENSDVNSSSGSNGESGEGEDSSVSGDDSRSSDDRNSDTEASSGEVDSSIDDEDSDSEGAGAFEEGNLEMERLTPEQIDEVIKEMKENKDFELALKFIVSILRMERKDAPLPPIQFTKSVKESTELMYDAFACLKTAPPITSPIPKIFKVFWKEVAAYLAIVSSPHHPLATALLISLDEQIMSSIWIIRKTRALESLWVKLWTGAIAHSQPDFCPPLLAGFVKTFNEPKRYKVLTPILKKTMAILFRHFAVRKMASKVVAIAKYLSSHLAVILFELCQRGLQSEVYRSVAMNLKYLISHIGQYTTLLSRPISGNAQTAKKNKNTLKQLHDKVISWGTLTLIGTTLSLIVLEKSNTEPFEPSPSRFGEPLLAILFALLRIQKNKVTYIPFHMKVLGLCLALSKCTQLYCPLGTNICDFGDCISVCISGQKSGKLLKKHTNLTKPAALCNLLILPDDQIAHSTFHENIVLAFKDVLIDYLCHLAHHPAFPEVSHVLMSTANKKYKTAPAVANVVKNLLPVVQATSSQIRDLRESLKEKTFSQKHATLNIIPDNLYGNLNLVRFASNRVVNSAIFIF